MAAVKRYNNVQLDGKPMKIEIVGTNVATSAGPPPAVANGSFGNSNGFSRGYAFSCLLLMGFCFNFVFDVCVLVNVLLNKSTY